MRREGEEKAKACHVKCDEGAYFTVGKSEKKKKKSTVGSQQSGYRQLAKN